MNFVTCGRLGCDARTNYDVNIRKGEDEHGSDAFRYKTYPQILW